MTTRNKTGEAEGFTWTYVSQFLSDRSMYEGLHSSEENRLWDGYGRTLDDALSAALDFAALKDNAIQRLVSVSVRRLVPGVTDVFDLPIVETYGKHAAKMNSRFGNRPMTRPKSSLRRALRKLHGPK